LFVKSTNGIDQIVCVVDPEFLHPGYNKNRKEGKENPPPLFAALNITKLKIILLLRK
jgi:hypothetical protein